MGRGTGDGGGRGGGGFGRGRCGDVRGRAVERARTPHHFLQLRHLLQRDGAGQEERRTAHNSTQLKDKEIVATGTVTSHRHSHSCERERETETEVEIQRWRAEMAVETAGRLASREVKARVQRTPRRREEEARREMNAFIEP